MSKLTRAEAARRNGAKSKGPVTPEGKARSARNSVRHGLTARSIPLANESEPGCAAMLDAYTAQFQPPNVVEEDLVEELVAAKWRQRRAMALQNAAIDLQMQKDEPQIEEEFDSLDGETRQVVAMTNLGRSDPSLWQNLHRYEIAAARAYHRALRTIRQLQSERKQQQVSDIQDHPRIIPIDTKVKLPNEPKEANK